MTHASEYEQQAQAFLDKHGLKFRATCAPSDFQRPPDWADDPSAKHGLLYKVTLWRGKNGVGRLSFDFWDSLHNREIVERGEWRGACHSDRIAAKKARPTAYDVLACIGSDVQCPETFEDFCGDYGLDKDSRKAEATWQRCVKFAGQLRDFFTEAEIDELAEIR